MSDRNWVRLLFVLFVLGAMAKSAFSQVADNQSQGIIAAAGVPDEFRWTLFVEKKRPPKNSNFKDSQGSLIARYVSRPVIPGDRVVPGDYPVSEKYLLQIPDKEGTLVVKYHTQIVYRTAVLRPDPFADERVPIAVIVDGKTMIAWVNSRFDEEARLMMPDVYRELANQNAPVPCADPDVPAKLCWALYGQPTRLNWGVPNVANKGLPYYALVIIQPGSKVTPSKSWKPNDLLVQGPDGRYRNKYRAVLIYRFDPKRHVLPKEPANRSEEQRRLFASEAISIAVKTKPAGGWVREGCFEEAMSFFNSFKEIWEEDLRAEGDR